MQNPESYSQHSKQETVKPLTVVIVSMGESHRAASVQSGRALRGAEMLLGGVFREELWAITLPAPPGATLATPQASPTGKALLGDIGLR